MKKIWAIAWLWLPSLAIATDYHVGPGQTYTTIGAVPWYRLQPGDTVYIHYKSTPYYEKFLISTRGTPSQWIRVLGVKGPNGELPIISGNNATTSTNMHWRDAWENPDELQGGGVIQLAHGDMDVQPSYIEIANLQVQDAYKGYRFTGENGQQSGFGTFSAAIYIRGGNNVWIRDCILTNSGQGIFTWSIAGPAEAYWGTYCINIRVSGNYFYNNGSDDPDDADSSHQIYMQSMGTTIEYNRFGPMRANAGGSQIKDRSAGTVIRYNYIEQAWGGYNIDLVEPENMDEIIASPTYAHDFVYGNIIMDNTGIGGNMIHYNEDHAAQVGRLMEAGGKLAFYNNTILVIANRAQVDELYIFHGQEGAGWNCIQGPLPGRIDVRNNIIAAIPRTTGSQAPIIKLAYCGNENVDLGVNWFSPGWGNYIKDPFGGTVTGAANIISPANNNPGFVNATAGDVHLVAGSSARGVGGALAPDVTNNVLGLDFTPTQQYVYHQLLAGRALSGIASDLGAMEYGAVGGNQFPSVATPASANPNPGTGALVNLSVLGDDDAGEAALTYIWSVTGTPPAAVTFGANSSNAAKNTTATFTRTGTYNLRVTIRDAGNLSTVSDVAVVVNPTLTSITVTPTPTSVQVSTTKQFTANGIDQFGQIMTAKPAFTWTLSGGGTINSSGRMTAGATAGGPFTVTAKNGSITGTAQVTVTVAPPPNDPPTVNITDPTDRDTFPLGTTITIAANATDADGTIVDVKFYADSTLLTTDTTNPYAYNWTNATVGNHTIRVVATDNTGATTQATQTITVNTANNGGGGGGGGGAAPTSNDRLVVIGDAPAYFDCRGTGTVEIFDKRGFKVDHESINGGLTYPAKNLSSGTYGVRKICDQITTKLKLSVVH